jgi:predicted phosphodiesterase
MSVVFYGDPHGVWAPLLAAVRDEVPDAVVLLGDCDLSRPLRDELAEIFDAGVTVAFVYGNHEKDSSLFWDRLVGDHPDGNLHGGVSGLGPFAMAGLAGVFKRRIWLPPAEPVFRTRDELLRSLSHQQRWRRGVPLLHRDAIFPEDFRALEGKRVDILVAHEAPSTHPLGFRVIDELAHALAARLIVFGHHHASSTGTTADGIRTVGLAKAEVFRLRAGDLP